MMSYDKYERGCQHLNSGHQRITYKKIKINKKIKIKIRLTEVSPNVVYIIVHKGVPALLLFIYINTECRRKKDTIICSTLSCRGMCFEVYLFF